MSIPRLQQRLAKLDEKIAQATADAREADAAYRQSAGRRCSRFPPNCKKRWKTKQWGDFGRGEGEIIRQSTVEKASAMS